MHMYVGLTDELGKRTYLSSTRSNKVLRTTPPSFLGAVTFYYSNRTHEILYLASSLRVEN